MPSAFVATHGAAAASFAQPQRAAGNTSMLNRPFSTYELTIRAMPLPSDYSNWLGQLGLLEINFGYGGIKLFTVEEMEGAQIGYSHSADAMSRTNPKPLKRGGNGGSGGTLDKREPCCTR